MRITLRVLVTMMVLAARAWSGEQVQNDWSQGDGVPGPVPVWAASFAEAEGVSWRAVPGQLALASAARPAPLRQVIGDGVAGALKVVAGDVDGDGDVDVLAAAYHGERLSLWLNQGGDPISWDERVIADHLSQPVGIIIADVDQDGLLDILAGTGEGGEILWWRNNGGDPMTWPQHTVATGFIGAHDVAVADIDGDGHTDIVGVAWEDDEVTWWRNNGSNPIAWSEHTIARDFDYACNLAVGDVDADGNVDVVATAWYDEEVAWWRNIGDGAVTWSRQTIAEGFTGTHWVEIADVNDDGHLDVAAAAMDRSEIAWWESSGEFPITWTKHSVTTTLAGAVSVGIADIDGDGDLDVLGSGWSTSGVAWWENLNGNGLSWTSHTVDRSFSEASSVHAADVDGDGALDLLATSWSRGEVAWWRVSEFVDSGSLTSSVLDTADSYRWIGCSWQAVLPPLTELELAARAGDDVQNMGEWQILTSDDPVAGLDHGRTYLQYRLTLSTEDPSVSPRVDAFGCAWTGPPPSPRNGGGRLP